MYLFRHTNNAVDLLGNGSRLSLRIAGIQHHAFNIVLQYSEQAAKGSNAHGSTPSVFVLQDNFARRATMTAEVNYIGLVAEKAALQVDRSGGPVLYDVELVSELCHEQCLLNRSDLFAKSKLGGIGGIGCEEENPNSQSPLRKFHWRLPVRMCQISRQQRPQFNSLDSQVVNCNAIRQVQCEQLQRSCFRHLK